MSFFNCRDLLVCVLIVGMGAGCGGSGDDSSAEEAPAALAGTIAGNDGTTGTLEVSFTAAATLKAGIRVVTSDATASGTLTLAEDGGTVSLTGTYTASSGSFELSGDDYDFSGTVSDGVMTGTFTGPDGDLGGFSGLDSTDGTVTLFCGTWSAGEDSGVWTVQSSSNGDASGSAMQTGGESTGNVVLLSGTISGTSVDIVSSEDVHATGTVSGSDISGSFTDLNGNEGVFSGSSGGCE